MREKLFNCIAIIFLWPTCVTLLEEEYVTLLLEYFEELAVKEEDKSLDICT